MSIFSYLERESTTDVRLLNEAMGILAVVESHPATEPHVLERIRKLEEAVRAHHVNDHRFDVTTVAFALREYPNAR
jgi:DNA-binding Lrp family transcriptional regulator